MTVLNLTHLLHGIRNIEITFLILYKKGSFNYTMSIHVRIIVNLDGPPLLARNIFGLG